MGEFIASLPFVDKWASTAGRSPRVTPCPVVIGRDRTNPWRTKGFAIKTIKKSKVSRIESLRREIDILRCVDHPCIIKLYDVYEDERFIHLVTELCTGGELFDRIIQKTESEEGHYSEKDAKVRAQASVSHGISSFMVVVVEPPAMVPFASCRELSVHARVSRSSDLGLQAVEAFCSGEGFGFLRSFRPPRFAVQLGVAWLGSSHDDSC